ncbi:TPA: ead/Ea22-like family protein [Klebsiella pneumoniae]|nr:ead/Ea22-like family protein [Klebsiella pneumoniae]HEE2029684.1 ead/Ea22-like family protein [Klebsiella pneumoniae]HEE2041037.1 ead/Ea22-like family protein [Klebsiella pneumoniae]HEE2752038.1 ead/Ea22-like family protein [Klebsiella pneumoniae]
MSKINYQALREAAEKATWGDWDSYKPHRGARGYEVRLSSQAIAQHVLKNNAEFIAAFNPKVALALLDERERNQQYIKRRDQENEEIALTVGKLRVELEAANKRIAELEAEPVSQAYNLAELIEGMEVSIDVSTCDADLGNRYFGTVTEALELDTAKNGYILLVQDAEPNFDVNGNYPVTPDGWISCSERMPDDGQHVIILCDGAFVLYAQYRDGEFFDIVRNGDEFFETQSRNVTNWMPLPEPPQEAK